MISDLKGHAQLRQRLARRHFTAFALGRLLTGGILLGLPVWAAAEGIWRCDGPNGAVEFRATPCPGDGGSPLETRDPAVGWDSSDMPERLRDFRQTYTPPPTRRSSGEAKANRKTQEQAERQRLACWKNEQRLEETQAKLRRGYTAKEADKLRRQRTRYEDYRDRFCDEEDDR